MLATAIFLFIFQAWADLPATCGTQNFKSELTHQDVAYQPEKKNGQLLDIWTPVGAMKPYKTVVLFHGGCFQIGGKAFDDTKDQINRLVKEGYAVVSVEYRRVKKDPVDGTLSNTYPAALDDARDAWCWLQKNGANRGLKTDKMVAAGFSAGATLALYLAAEHAEGTTHDPGCAPKTAGASVLSPRTNFLKATEPHSSETMDCGEAFCGQHREEGNPQPIFHQADVNSNLDVAKMPAIYISAGKKDKFINFNNAETLCNKLGNKCTHEWLEEADHLFEGKGEMDRAYSGACKYLAEIFKEPEVQMSSAGSTQSTVRPTKPGDAQR